MLGQMGTHPREKRGKKGKRAKNGGEKRVTEERVGERVKERGVGERVRGEKDEKDNLPEGGESEGEPEENFLERKKNLAPESPESNEGEEDSIVRERQLTEDLRHSSWLGSIDMAHPEGSNPPPSASTPYPHSSSSSSSSPNPMSCSVSSPASSAAGSEGSLSSLIDTNEALYVMESASGKEVFYLGIIDFFGAISV